MGLSFGRRCSPDELLKRVDMHPEEAMSLHTVESTTETVRSGFLDPSAPSVATIASGDTVSYPNTWTHWGNEAAFGMTFAERESLRHRYPNGPYSMLGPVVVIDAEARRCHRVQARVAAQPGPALHVLGRGSDWIIPLQVRLRRHATDAR